VKEYALSLKQPWPPCLCRRKTIEVASAVDQLSGATRFLSTPPMSRQKPEAWAHVLARPRDAPDCCGPASICVGTRVDVSLYSTARLSHADRTAHLNEPPWFEKRAFGFAFNRLDRSTFRRRVTPLGAHLRGCRRTARAAGRAPAKRARAILDGPR